MPQLPEGKEDEKYDGGRYKDFMRGQQLHTLFSQAQTHDEAQGTQGRRQSFQPSELGFVSFVCPKIPLPPFQREN